MEKRVINTGSKSLIFCGPKATLTWTFHWDFIADTYYNRQYYVNETRQNKNTYVLCRTFQSNLFIITVFTMGLRGSTQFCGLGTSTKYTRNN